MGRALSSPPVLRHPAAPRDTDALTAREVDALVSRLLSEMKIPYGSMGKRILQQLADLKKILTTDYREAAGLPSRELLTELAGVVDKEIISQRALWERWDDPRLFDTLGDIFGPREIAVRAEPYRSGAGLSLRGFFCRAELGEKAKFVIFLNTAHHPGAVAATLGHELGHYIYGSLKGESSETASFMEGTLASHLTAEDELFADCLVALAAYPGDTIKRIGLIHMVIPGSADSLFTRIKQAYDQIGPRFNLDLRLRTIPAAWRIRYLTSMTHFFKLRCAVLDTARL